MESEVRSKSSAMLTIELESYIALGAHISSHSVNAHHGEPTPETSTSDLVVDRSECYFEYLSDGVEVYLNDRVTAWISMNNDGNLGKASVLFWARPRPDV